MKFNIGEEVKIKATGYTGEVIHYKHEIFTHSNGETSESHKYSVMPIDGVYGRWCDESEIESAYEFSDEFENGLIDLLIDVNLKVGKIDNVKELFNMKKNT